MDSRYESQSRAPAQPSWSTAQGGQQGAHASGEATAVADRESKVESLERTSPDPLRSTDRYRLVVPYSLRV
ncbi:MAG: hypothetical protein FJ265_10735 [Planctomycetes bacterium]|nr:hypothetical protein [Planctomycetota bacterium]